MAKPTPFEELIEGLALIFIFVIFGLLFLVAAAIILISNPISCVVAAFCAYVLWAASEGKLL